MSGSQSANVGRLISKRYALLAISQRLGTAIVLLASRADHHRESCCRLWLDIRKEVGNGTLAPKVILRF